MLIPDFRWEKAEDDEAARNLAKSISNFVKEKVKEQRAMAKIQVDGQRDVTMIYGNLSSGTEKIESVFGSNLPRLRELKKKYDPDLLWNKWYPITPD